jgi:hypothetical protein
MKPCSYCGRENPEGTTFCVECGTPLEASSKLAEVAAPVPGLQEPGAIPAATHLRRNKKILIVLAAVLVGIALYLVFSSSDSPEMDSPEVIQIADQVLLHAGFSLNTFAQPIAKFEQGATSRVWQVIYDRKTPSYSQAARPGSQNAPRALRVTVDDKTKQTEVAVSRDTVGGGTVKIPPQLKTGEPGTQAVDGQHKGE